MLDLRGVDDDLAILRDRRQHPGGDRQRRDADGGTVDARRADAGEQGGREGEGDGEELGVDRRRGPRGSPDEAIDRENTVWPDRESYDQRPVSV